MCIESIIQKQIANDLKVSGVRHGGAVLVHSSLKSMGYVPGGPETVIRGFLDALGREGTLLIPALSWRYVNAENPFFDLLRTPSNIGTIPEYFRQRKGTIRSVNPTHSVCAVGAAAREMLQQHHLDNTPCGQHSPYRILRDYGGQIVFIGCGLRPNTSMHAVEELVEPPYLFGQTITYQVILADGRSIQMPCRRHSFDGWRQRYDRIAKLLNDDELKIGKVLEAKIHIIETGPMWDRALDQLQKDPFYFVEKVG